MVEVQTIKLLNPISCLSNSSDPLSNWHAKKCCLRGSKCLNIPHQFNYLMKALRSESLLINVTSQQLVIITP